MISVQLTLKTSLNAFSCHKHHTSNQLSKNICPDLQFHGARVLLWSVQQCNAEESTAPCFQLRALRQAVQSTAYCCCLAEHTSGREPVLQVKVDY